MGGYSSLASLRHLRTSGRQAPASATGGYRILSFALDVARRHSACKGDGRPHHLESRDAHRSRGRFTRRELSTGPPRTSGSVLFATQRRLAGEADRDQPAVAEVLTHQAKSHRGLARLVARERERAAVEKVDHRGIAQNRQVCPGII